MPLYPWQEWLVIHAGELLEDGTTPRFRQVLVLVARQNGKTHVLRVMALYWLYIERVRLVMCTSAKLDTAKETWTEAVDLARSTPALNREIHPKNGVRYANGEQTLTVNRCRFKIAASTASSLRGYTVNRLIMDELREHETRDAFAAAEPTTRAVEDSQIWMISNAGSDKSEVLNQVRAEAIAGVDEGLGIFEWSAPDGAAPTDLEALAMANPSLGHRMKIESLIGLATRAELAGGNDLAVFLTETHCRHVPMMDPAIDASDWLACLDPSTLDGVRGRIALCMDVSPDLNHATLYAAGLLEDGRARVEPVAAWSGRGCTETLRGELPGLVAKVKPAKFGWFPSGPAAALAADLKEHPGWPPAGVDLEDIRADVAAVCMGFAEQVTAAKVAHSGDPLLDAHIAGAEKLTHGDGWRFSRKGAGHVDALYAAAGAVHLARTLVSKPVGVFFA